MEMTIEQVKEQIKTKFGTSFLYELNSVLDDKAWRELSKDKVYSREFVVGMFDYNIHIDLEDTQYTKCRRSYIEWGKFNHKIITEYLYSSGWERKNYDY